jgi:hypothetical protein
MVEVEESENLLILKGSVGESCAVFVPCRVSEWRGEGFRV